MENSSLYLNDYTMCTTADTDLTLQKKMQNLKLNDNLFTPCDLINSELFFNDLNESITNQNKDENYTFNQQTKDSTDSLTIQSSSTTTAANLIEIETVKNKLSSLWNNVKYGWASYIKKPTKIPLEKSGPIYILGKKFNPNNPYESPVSMNHLNSNETHTYDIIDGSLNESFINPSIPIFNDSTKLKPSINNDYYSSSASLSTSPMSYLNNKFINHQSYYLVDTTKKKNSYLQQQTDSEAKSHLEKELHSRLWFTYRKDFKPLNGNLKYTSDCGWGCMLRSAQMLLAQAFLLHFFGKEWSLYKKFKTEEYNLYKEIISWFNDRPSRHCPFGIHRLLHIADKKLIGNSNDSSQLGSRVGSWFGPTSVCLLMKEALNESIDYKPVLDQIKLYVAQDCTIYKQDVIDLCLDSRTNFFKPCIILVSVRLGGEDLNDMYVSSLKRFLESDTCIGIIGGKPKHSLYFIGYQGDKVIYLDPHFCQPTTNIYSNNDPTIIANNISPVSSLSSSKHSYDDSSDYEVFENSSYHCENPSMTPFNKLDPSLAIGFYCATLKDLNNLCEFVKKVFFLCDF